MGQAFGDVDNDGDEDLYVGATFEPKLLRHEDDHSCVDLTAATGANPLVERAPSLGPMVWAAVFLDHDNDGRLDLLLTEGDLINPPGEGDVLPAYPSPIDLLVQQPDGTFVDQGAALGLAREGSHRGALAEDLNDDGVLDLLVAEADRPLQVYLSTGCLAAAHLRIEAPEGTVARVQIDGLERFGVVRAEQGVGVVLLTHDVDNATRAGAAGLKAQTAKAGISRVHGLRHQYAQRRYRQLTGWKAPAAGGPTSKQLSVDQKALDREARLVVSRELGHEREQITSVYLGR
jgi:hypothetical protein